MSQREKGQFVCETWDASVIMAGFATVEKSAVVAELIRSRLMLMSDGESEVRRSGQNWY